MTSYTNHYNQSQIRQKKYNDIFQNSSKKNTLSSALHLKNYMDYLPNYRYLFIIDKNKRNDTCINDDYEGELFVIYKDNNLDELYKNLSLHFNTEIKRIYVYINNIIQIVPHGDMSIRNYIVSNNIKPNFDDSPVMYKIFID